MLEYEFDMPIEVEAAFKPQCRVLERLPKRRVRDIWQQWNAIYPPVNQFSSVKSNLRRRHALEAYLKQDHHELYILMVGPLAGWRCECEQPPVLTDDVFAIVVIVPPDLAWSYDQCDFLFRDRPESPVEG